MSTYLVCLALCAAVVGPAPTEGWTTKEYYEDVQVVVADTATEPEKYAATEFQKYWEMTTGVRPELSNVPGKGVNVWIGMDGVPAEYAGSLDVDGLGPDGLHVKTFPGDLLIVGGRPRGTLYGVYEFFERYMGVRWLTPEVTHVPDAPEALPAIDFRYVPPFEWRDVFYRAFVQNPSFAAIYKLNGNSQNIPPEMGGHIGYIGSFGHTFHNFVSPDEYGESHPEYFSLVNGKRRVVTNGSQLCLTNPDVLRIVTDKVRAMLREHYPERRIVSVTQMDTGFWCECDQCKAIDDEEGSQSGTVIRFVNQIAEAIEGEFPEAVIDTFAYTYTRKPPRHVRPRDNVLVRLCSIEANFAKPLADATEEHNKAFQEDIAGWAPITKHLYVWDYTQNWYCFQQPHPNFHVLQPNVKFFADNGVKGLFEQCSPSSPHSDFEYLKGYIVAHAVWNPEDDWRARYNEFIDLYYRQAGPYIREYIDLITKKVLDDEYYMGFNSRMEWMDYDTAERAEAIFQKAFEAAGEDAELRARLESVYLSVQYAALVCTPRIEITDSAYVLSRPPSMTFDEYWSRLMEMGVTAVGDEPIEHLRKRFAAGSPPRHAELTIEKLENPFLEVWIVPELHGAIVRFADKNTGVDLFRGDQAILYDRWMLRDWEVMDQNAPHIEEGIATGYTVTARTPDSVTVQTILENGLEIRRKMTLGPDGTELDVVFEVANSGAAPLVPRVKLHPEFWTQGRTLPEVWLEKDGRWAEHPIQFAQTGLVGGGHIEPAGISRWAFYMPDKDLSLVSAVRADEIENLFYYVNAENEHINLEHIPRLAPLAPGETRSVHVTYAFEQGRPH